jgi:hypothetical protein
MARRQPEQFDDLHDYCAAPSKRRSGHRRAADERPIVVTDDWPDRVPIGKLEVRLFESHLRKELDELFGALP